MATSVFERKEIKYPISREQRDGLLSLLGERIKADEYGLTTICNIYFDTPDSRLIRESLEKPMYKEKLRLRTYGVPGESSTAFIELKKKFDGIVYKRREILPYAEAMRFLTEGKAPERESQILRELKWTLDFYGSLVPAMVLCYDRIAYFAPEDPEIRVTFDSNIRYRTEELDLMQGAHGRALLEDDQFIMELKISGAMPLWLSHALDQLKIYPGSYTKYGNAYKTLLSEGVFYDLKRNLHKPAS